MDKLIFRLYLWSQTAHVEIASKLPCAPYTKLELMKYRYYHRVQLKVIRHINNWTRSRVSYLFN